MASCSDSERNSFLRKSSSSASRSDSERVGGRSLSPQRQRGVSPLIRQTTNSAADRTAIDTIQRAKCLGASRNAAPQTSASHTAKTTHPCHAHGRPQPHPYRLAVNHTGFSFVSMMHSPLLRTFLTRATNGLLQSPTQFGTVGILEFGFRILDCGTGNSS